MTCLSWSNYTDTDPTSRERGWNPQTPDEELHAQPVSCGASTNGGNYVLPAIVLSVSSNLAIILLLKQQ